MPLTPKERGWAESIKVKVKMTLFLEKVTAHEFLFLKNNIEKVFINIEDIILVFFENYFYSLNLTYFMLLRRKKMGMKGLQNVFFC